MSSPNEIISYTYDRTRCKSPIFSVPLHEEFFTLIGRIVTSWGAFESMFDDTLIMFERALSVKPERLNCSFQQRAKRYKKYVEVCFPEIATQNILSAIADDGIHQQVDRNLLAHGRLSFIIGGPENLVVAQGFKSGAPIEKRYSFLDLEQTFFDLSHLGGRLFALGIPSEAMDFPGISSQDREKLQDICRRCHPNFVAK